MLLKSSYKLKWFHDKKQLYFVLGIFLTDSRHNFLYSFDFIPKKIL